MADFVFTVALGRVVEMYRRVNGNDPANSSLIVVALKATGISTDATLKDCATLSSVLSSGTTAEATNTGYARKVLTSSQVDDVTPSYSTDLTSLNLANITWTAVSSTGGNWAKLLICYDPDTTVAGDSTIVPLTAHDFAASPSGADITAQFSSNGFYRAA